MTYWVVAKVNGKVYMAADSRVSTGSHTFSGMSDYADVSEKLFSNRYRDREERSVCLGICTSGTASVNVYDYQKKESRSISIADMLKEFLLHVSREKTTFNSAEQVIPLLYQYMAERYKHCAVFFSSLVDAPKFADYIANTTYFGIGLCYAGKASVAGYNTRSCVTGFNYIEASFGTSCITALYGERFSNVEETLAFVGSLEPTGTTPDPVVDFVSRIIAVSPSTFSARQTIGGDTDYAILSEGNITMKIGYKAEVENAPKETPYMLGHDRTFFSPPNYHTAIDTDPSRASVSTREPREQYTALSYTLGGR